MKNKLIVLGMILSFHIFSTDLWGQVTNSVSYTNPNTLSGSSFNFPGSLHRLNTGGYLYFPRHTFSSGVKAKPEIAYLNSDLSYEINQPISFINSNGRGAVIHEAKSMSHLGPLYNNIYAIVGSYTTSGNSEFENEAIVFLWDIVNRTAVSRILSLGIHMNEFFSTTPAWQKTAGMGFVEISGNVGMVVHTNSRQYRQDHNLYVSSTLNLISITPGLGGIFDLKFDNAYDMQPRNTDKTVLRGVDMEMNGNEAILLSTCWGFSVLTRSIINHTGSAFIIETSGLNDNPMIRIASNSFPLPNQYPIMALNKIQIYNGQIILSGNQGGTWIQNDLPAVVDPDKGIIMEGSINNIFNPAGPLFDDVKIYTASGGTLTLNCSAEIDPNIPERMAVYSTSNSIDGIFTPQISFFNRNSYEFDFIQNSTNNHGIAFLSNGMSNGGVNKYWSPMCFNNNLISIATTGGINAISGLRNFSYAYNSSGLETPEETNECVAEVAYETDNHDLHFMFLENEPDLFVPSDSEEQFDGVELNLVSVPECTNKAGCAPLVAALTNCNEISISVEGFNDGNTTIDWNNNGNISSGVNTTINDLECHYIQYSYNGLICEKYYQACISLGQFECAQSRSKQGNQTEMTRWTLDNAVTEFASAQKQMKDGNKHTLCYEKYNNKSGKFEQISCEEVQSNEDLTKVEFDFTAYPSPASDQITIDVTNFSTEENYKAILFTNSGSNVKEFRLKSKTAQYSLEGVNSGSYILTMYQGNKKVSSKTIIVKK